MKTILELPVTLRGQSHTVSVALSFDRVAVGTVNPLVFFLDGNTVEAHTVEDAIVRFYGQTDPRTWQAEVTANGTPWLLSVTGAGDLGLYTKVDAISEDWAWLASGTWDFVLEEAVFDERAWSSIEQAKAAKVLEVLTDKMRASMSGSEPKPNTLSRKDQRNQAFSGGLLQRACKPLTSFLSGQARFAYGLSEIAACAREEARRKKTKASISAAEKAEQLANGAVEELCGTEGNAQSLACTELFDAFENGCLPTCQNRAIPCNMVLDFDRMDRWENGEEEKPTRGPYDLATPHNAGSVECCYYSIESIERRRVQAETQNQIHVNDPYATDEDVNDAIAVAESTHPLAQVWMECDHRAYATMRLYEEKYGLTGPGINGDAEERIRYLRALLRHEGTGRIRPIHYQNIGIDPNSSNPLQDAKDLLNDTLKDRERDRGRKTFGNVKLAK